MKDIREHRVEVFIQGQWWHWKDIETHNIDFFLDRLSERHPGDWKWRVESVAPTFELPGMDLSECMAMEWERGGIL